MQLLWMKLWNFLLAKESDETMNNLYLIIGPSGSGKTSLTEGLSWHLGMKQVESYTTRSPRYPDEAGHMFVSDEEFDKLGEMCAYTEFDGYRYGVTKDILDNSDVYVIDPYGAMYLLDHYSGKPLRYIWLATSPGVCYERMIHRGDSEDKVKKRIENDADRFRLSDLACILSRIPGIRIVTDKYSPAQVMEIVKKSISKFERVGDLYSTDKEYSGLLEEE